MDTLVEYLEAVVEIQEDYFRSQIRLLAEMLEFAIKEGL